MSQDARFDDEQAALRRARILGMTYIDTSQIPSKTIYKDVLTIKELYELRVIPINVDKYNIAFGVTNTTSQQTMTALRQRFQDQRISFSLISDVGFREYMRLYDPPKKVEYQDIALNTAGTEELLTSVSKTLDTVRADDIFAYLVQQAHRLNSSDIHIETQHDRVRIRFRIDGVLHPIAILTFDKYKTLMGVIASAANVSTNADDAQQGHIAQYVKMADETTVAVNVRLETVPTINGMDVVMRLFNMDQSMYNLDKLGLSPQQRVVVDDIIARPNGLVLMVGPTGSGKTTTLYSILNTLNSDQRKIITIEDPVEYQFSGITQIPVNTQKSGQASFGDKLRAVLRLDPDVVMVGEIRDADTAKTSLQAALTGHLVLSTFHAGSAAAALTRMLDAIGINPLFASAMHLVMAQRLVRRLDDATKQPYQPDDALKAHMKQIIDTLPPNVARPDLTNITLYNPGSSEDNPYGYGGQIALREQLLMTPGVKELLKLPPNQITTDMLEKKAVEEGMVTMLQDGILKVIEGITTLDEVYRVVG